MYYVQKNIYNQSLLLFIVLLFIISVFFMQYILPLVWIVVSIITVFLFFHFFFRLSQRWLKLPEEKFRKNIFWTSLWIRVAYVILSYAFYTFMTDIPFEFSARDSRFYHYFGLRLADAFLMGNFDLPSLIYIKKLSSWGMMILTGSVYALFFDSIIALRIVNALLGAWACVLIYDIARRSFGDHAGRISAILAVLAPPLIYYCGLHLKAGVILFLTVFFINIADRVLKERQLVIKDLILLFGTAAVMLLFRNSLAFILLFSFIVSLVFVSKRVSPFFKRSAIGFLLAGFLMVLITFDLAPKVQEEAWRYMGYRETHIEDHMRLYASRGNVFATYAKKTIFAPLAFVGPLPTLVDTQQDNSAMMAGVMFVRNIYGFFMFFGILFLIKQKQLRNHILLLAVFFSWLFVIANSGFALQDRFHLIFVPIIMIFSGYAISMADKKIMGYFSLYLVFLGVLIFSWNWFKLAGRGLI
jgi:4-amino-4-deoxy-L-arabinose transferase-like glycosyltransferase